MLGLIQVTWVFTTVTSDLAVVSKLWCICSHEKETSNVLPSWLVMEQRSNAVNGLEAKRDLDTRETRLRKNLKGNRNQR